jgi:uncharacterized membrane protein YphA (DoxX/SURF4 family)
MGWRGHRWLALGARLYLAGIFVFACWPKISDPSLFALQVAAYEILPIWGVGIVATVLPWLELAAALLLATGIAVRWAAAAAAAMLGAYAIAGAAALARGLDLSCGCFGAGDPIGAWSLARNGIWLAIAAYVFVLDREPLGLGALLQRR